MARTVLITGVSGYLGDEVAGVLRHEPEIARLIEVAEPDTVGDHGGPAQARQEHPGDDRAGQDRPADGDGPADPPRDADELVVRIDARTAEIGDIINATGADTVVHLGVATTPRSAGGRASMKETNIIGAIQLLNACQRSPSVRKLVVRSSTAVYGTSPGDPAVFTEDVEPRASHGYAKDILEIERYVRGLARRRPDITVSVLRFVNFLGRRVGSPLTRYFMLPVTPTVLGYDPRIQFVDITDAAEVIRRMVLEDHRGTFNVTGRGAMLISQCLRRAGRLPMPIPAQAFGTLADLGRGLFPDVSPEQRDLLRFGRVVDGTKLETELGWTPRYTTQDAFTRFVADRGLTGSGAVGAIGRLLRATFADTAGGSG
jgi:UDP-glucose 4-epimerase